MHVGIDLMEVARIAKSIKSERFIKRVFSKEEIEYAKSKHTPSESFAAFFAAKEAFGKALGIGLTGFGYTEVYITHDERGKPNLSFRGKALEIVKEKDLQFDVSLSHTKSLATAVVVATRKG